MEYQIKLWDDFVTMTEEEEDEFWENFDKEDF
jgi:hypothetical protein